MQITPPHGRDGSDKIFLNMEYADTVTDGQRGELMQFDLTNNLGQAGIYSETRGLRCVRHIATTDYIDFNSAGVLETDGVQKMPAIDSVNGASRGKMVLVQCYGFHDSVQYAGVSSPALGRGAIVPHNNSDGKMSCQTAATLAVITPVGVAMYAALGFNAVAAPAASFSGKPAMIKSMGM